MNELTYAQINLQNLKNNIHNMKQNYPFSHTILDVSNNAFFHGMYLILKVTPDIDYLYTIHFSDVLLIRKYSADVPIIYGGEINENNIFDLILNNVILLIRDEAIIDLILHLKIKDQFDILFNIDIDGYHGISSKHILVNILEKLEEKINIHILGVKAQVTEKNYLDFKYIISPLKNLELVILNNEREKKKIKMSNAIILDASIYGIDMEKNKFLKKEALPIEPILEIKSHITNIIIKRKGKKETIIGVIPFGYHHGFLSSISSVFINEKKYTVKEVHEEFTLILIDKTIKKDDIVTIVGNGQMLHSLHDVLQLTSTLSMHYDDYTLEKKLVY